VQSREGREGGVRSWSSRVDRCEPRMSSDLRNVDPLRNVDFETGSHEVLDFS